MEAREDLKIFSQNLTLPEFINKHTDYNDWLDTRWEIDIRFGFSGLQDIKVNNPKITDLKNYEISIDSKFEYIRKSVTLTPSQAELLMIQIPKEDRNAGFYATVLRLERETEYLRELEDVGISAALLQGLENGRFGSFTLFLAPDSFFARGMRRKGAEGMYASILDTVVIPQKAPTPEEMWLMLATDGRLPKVVSHLDHELTHDRQWSIPQRIAILGLISAQSISYFTLLHRYGLAVAIGFSNAIGWLSRRLVKKVDNDEMLSEIHAFEASASSPSAIEEEFDERHEIADHVIGAYNPKDKDYFDALKAYDLIHTLRILGLDDKALGKLVSMARFDENTGTFPKLEQAILKRKKDWGITNNLDFEKLTEALLAKHSLELRYQRHKAQEIAVRELHRETGRWFT